MMENPRILAEFPKDVIARAKAYKGMLSGGSVGAYTDSRGVPGVRDEVAEFITKRDQRSVSADDIYITNGASRAVCMTLTALLRSAQDGVLVPIPQYPLYSASIQLHNGTLLPYYLDEKDNWSFSLPAIERTIMKAIDAGMTVRAFVLINPGNPTGQCLTEAELVQLAKFCIKHRLVLMSDEVYQSNVYQDERPFIAMHKILNSLPMSLPSELELISFHSASKGNLGECGLRGGYMHTSNCAVNFKRDVYKLLSISLSPNVVGNIMVGLMVKPPVPGDESFALYDQENRAIGDSLRRRAHMITDAFNACEGMTCNFTEGAMYSFPQIRLPAAAIAEADKQNRALDTFYCFELLNATGISMVPGSGFGQEEGTFHIRTTILPQEDDLATMVATFKKFHASFMDKYRDSAPLSKM